MFYNKYLKKRGNKMNNNVKKLIETSSYYFFQSVELGVIDKDYACDCVIELNNPWYIYFLAIYHAHEIKKENSSIKIHIGTCSYINQI